MARLGEGERMLILAMRDWVAAASRGRCPVDAITPRMLAHRLVGALEPFHFLMATLARHGRSRFEFGCPCHGVVSEGEAVLLGALLADPVPGRAGPGWLVERPYVARVGEAIAALRAALALAGMSPPVR
ncbi:hypothetical protein J4558_02555 [Leptolyngbya sp. 15MV]|nr:hypothetical protein J4558_02555 [Leptolyngbya sp. 15MV]